MQRRSFLILIIVALAGCAKDTAASGPRELRPLTVDQVATRIAAKDGKTFLYDANPKEVWQKAHVPGAKWVDDENIKPADLATDKSATLIFYCHNES